jgi:diguanylate cyclase (GGDEF)-like protein
MHDGKPREARMRLRHKEGHPIPVLMRTVPIRDRHGIIVGAAESFEEQRLASDRDRRQRNLTYDCADETTGMPNHEFTQFHLRENLTSFEQYHLPFGIMRIRVDRLKEFQAAYGRQAGDAILRVVAQTMRDSLRPSDFLGRWEEDEFLVILANCGTPGVERAAARIRRVVSCAGLRWWGDELTVTTWVGHSIAQAGDTIDSLLTRAQGSLQKMTAVGTGPAATTTGKS